MASELLQGQPGSSNTPYQAASSFGASQVQHRPSLPNPPPPVFYRGSQTNQTVPEVPGELLQMVLVLTPPTLELLTQQNWVKPRVPISDALPRSAAATGKTLERSGRYVRRCPYYFKIEGHVYEEEARRWLSQGSICQTVSLELMGKAALVTTIPTLGHEDRQILGAWHVLGSMTDCLQTRWRTTGRYPNSTSDLHAYTHKHSVCIQQQQQKTEGLCSNKLVGHQAPFKNSLGAGLLRGCA